MKLSIYIQIIAVVAVYSHHCNEYHCAFFQGKRRGAEEDLVHRHDMHSFTGAEGIDHHTSDSGLSGPTSRRSGGHKSVLQTNNNLLRRHDMHSFTGTEGIDHCPIEGKGKDAAKRPGRRLPSFKTSHPIEEEIAGE
jgi:hypothetical protein